MRILRNAVFFAAALAGCSSSERTETTAPARAAQPAVVIEAARLTAFAPLPAVMASPGQTVRDEQIALGRKLYYETRLSAARDQSCNSCHDLKAFGVDHKPVSDGFKGRTGTRNSPTVYNAAGHVAQFWDGRAATVEEQAKGPILNPVEMGMPSAKAVEQRLRAIPEYREAFAKAFPGQKQPITFDNVGTAIGAFERKLVTPARWDRFLAGDRAALTDDEKRGFDTFMDSGCAGCHAEAYVGGAMFQKAGVVKPWPSQKDLGRYQVTKQAADKMLFKVPSLRNVEKTGPYFHDGSVASLDEAVVMMGRHQLGKELSGTETASIVTWLKTLTGEPDPQYIAEPAKAQ